MSSNFALLRHTIVPPKFSAGKLTFIENNLITARMVKVLIRSCRDILCQKNLLTLVHKIMFLKYGKVTKKHP